MGAARRLRTFEELYAEIAALPEGEAGEILGPGVLRTMSRPPRAHRAANKRILRQLAEVDADAGGGWWIDSEVEVVLPGGRLYVPDLAGWRVTEEDTLDFLDENPVQRIPDWACEILSRTTQRGDRALKLPQYSDAGVAHIWVIEPESRVVEVYESTGRGPLLVATVAGSQRRPLPPFDLSICPEELFSARGRRPGRRARR